MNFDIRIPIGALFSLLGGTLLLYGLITKGDALYERSFGLNVNIIWGAVMLAFGVLMWSLAQRAKRRPSPARREEAEPAPPPSQRFAH